MLHNDLPADHDKTDQIRLYSTGCTPSTLPLLSPFSFLREEKEEDRRISGNPLSHNDLRSSKTRNTVCAVNKPPTLSQPTLENKALESDALTSRSESGHKHSVSIPSASEPDRKPTPTPPCPACATAQEKHPSWLCAIHRRPGCHPVTLTDGSIEYPDAQELEAAGAFYDARHQTNVKHRGPMTCSACNHRPTTATLRRAHPDTPWSYRCPSCLQDLTETAPRSGQFSDGVHATLWLLENDR